jgi:hypothetical protein
VNAVYPQFFCSLIRNSNRHSVCSSGCARAGVSIVDALRLLHLIKRLEVLRQYSSLAISTINWVLRELRNVHTSQQLLMIDFQLIFFGRVSPHGNIMSTSSLFLAFIPTVGLSANNYSYKRKAENQRIDHQNQSRVYN